MVTSPSRVRVAIGFAITVVIVTTLPAFADLDDVVAVRAQVADALTGVSLSGKMINSQAGMASLTKVMTTDLVLHAIANGQASMNDVLEITQLDEGLPCTCYPRGGGPPSGQLVEGDTLLVQDALYDMPQSPNDTVHALAEYTANAVNHATRTTGTSLQESKDLVAEFVAMMNQHAADLGLKNTHYANPEGFDDANHHTTTSDLIKLWIHASEDPSFLPIMGTRRYTFSWWDDSAQLLRNQTLNHPLVGYYPGIDGAKNGSQPSCNGAGCLMAQATRLGRPAVAVALQSGGFNQSKLDVAEMLRLGFEALFFPDRTGENDTDGGASIAHAMDCRGIRALVAVRTPENLLGLQSWYATPGNGSLTLRDATTSRARASGRVDVAFLGDERAVTATGLSARQPGKAVTSTFGLATWSVPALGKPEILSSTRAMAGSGAAVTGIGSSRFVVAFKRSDGSLRLQLWKVAADGGLDLMALADDSSSPGVTSDLDLVAMTPPKYSLPSKVLTIAKVQGGGVRVIRWSVDAEVTSGRQAHVKRIVRISTITEPSGSRVAITKLATSGEFASSRRGQGGALTVSFYRLTKSGISLNYKLTLPTSSPDETAIARIGPSDDEGVVTSSVGADDTLTMTVWEPDWLKEGAPAALQVLSAVTDDGVAQSVDMCRVEDAAPSVGEYVTAVRGDGGALRLAVWRVAPQP